MQNNITDITAQLIMNILLQVRKELAADEKTNPDLVIFKSAASIAIRLCNIDLLKLLLNELKESGTLEAFDQTYCYNIRGTLVESLAELVTYLSVSWKENPAVNGGVTIWKKESG